MSQTKKAGSVTAKNNGTKAPGNTVLKSEKIEISLNHVIRENETANQLKKRLAKERRNATNEAGKVVAKAIRNGFLSLSVVRNMFANVTTQESADFCAKLSAEIGKTVTVDDVYKLPMREYMDFVKETEAVRGMTRGGITPTEFKNIITRYYRGEKCAKSDDLTRDVLTDIYSI
jgi:hypothetical protein